MTVYRIGQQTHLSAFFLVCLLLSASKLCCAHLSLGCLRAVFLLSFLPDHPLWLCSLPSLVGLQLLLRYERSALTDVCERIQHGLCVLTLSNYVIFCSGFPLRPQSALADCSMREQWLNVSLFKQHFSPVIWSSWKSFGQCQPGSLNFPEQLGKPMKFFCLSVHEQVTCMSTFVDGASQWHTLISVPRKKKKKSQTNSDANLISSQEMLSKVGGELKGAFSVGKNE